jgi:cellulose biosynthesis protein BcsQ
MPPILITNHKGGTGKTFVTVHLASRLSEKGKRILVADCDGQYDAFAFFAKSKRAQDGDLHQVNPHLYIMANQSCQSLKRHGIEEDNYDYVLLDADARLADSVKNILQNKVELVLTPVNPQLLSIRNLEDLFVTLSKLYEMNAPFKIPKQSSDPHEQVEASVKKVAKLVAKHVLVVQLAANSERLVQLLKKFRVKTKVLLTENMAKMENESNDSLFKGTLVWDLAAISRPKREKALEFFDKLAEKVDQFFGL